MGPKVEVGGDDLGPEEGLGRLVADQYGSVDERVEREGLESGSQPDLLQGVGGHLAPLSAADALVQQPGGHVVDGAHGFEQVELLEDETDSVRPQPGQGDVG